MCFPVNALSYSISDDKVNHSGYEMLAVIRKIDLHSVVSREMIIGSGKNIHSTVVSKTQLLIVTSVIFCWTRRYVYNIKLVPCHCW